MQQTISVDNLQHLFRRLRLLQVLKYEPEFQRSGRTGNELPNFVLKNGRKLFLSRCWVIIFQNLFYCLHKSLSLSLELILCLCFSQLASKIHTDFQLNFLFRVSLSNQVSQFRQGCFCSHISTIVNVKFLQVLFHDGSFLLVNVLWNVHKYFSIILTCIFKNLQQFLRFWKICCSVTLYHITDDIWVFEVIFQDLFIQVKMKL